jgi:hypothetical protein
VPPRWSGRRCPPGCEGGALRLSARGRAACPCRAGRCRTGCSWTRTARSARAGPLRSACSPTSARPGLAGAAAC